MSNKKTIYVVSFKRYGDDSYCGCEFHPIVAFNTEEEAKRYAEQDDEYDYDTIEYQNRRVSVRGKGYIQYQHEYYLNITKPKRQAQKGKK